MLKTNSAKRGTHPRHELPVDAARWDRAFEIVMSILIGFGFFVILLCSTPDISIGDDGYRHAKLALRLVTEPRAMLADPWRLEHFWRAPVDVWFGYHALLAPFMLVFEPIEAAKLFSSVIFGLIAYILFRLLRELHARYAFVWVLSMLAGNTLSLLRATTLRPFLLSLLLVLLAALLTIKDRPVPLALVSMLHAMSYSVFAFVGIGSAVWFLLRRDRRSGIAALACGAGMALGLLANPYFPENLRFDSALASVVGQRAHIYMGEYESSAATSGTVIDCLPMALPWIGALILRLRNWRQSTPAADLFLWLSGATFLGALRVVRTVDFFVPFSLLFAAAAISPYLKTARANVVAVGVVLALLICSFDIWRVRQFVSEAPSLARYRGAAEYLKVNAPGALVANAQCGDYQFLFFLNSSNRYLVGIEPTLFFLADPRKYWLWLHMSEDNPDTCDHEFCSDSDRTDIVAAVRQNLGAQYVLVGHKANPRLDFILRGKTNVTEVYRDPAFSVYRIDS
jgi:hypothetical protein